VILMPRNMPRKLKINLCSYELSRMPWSLTAVAAALLDVRYTDTYSRDATYKYALLKRCTSTTQHLS
jgi:hypothetical protein